ncbi:MAG: hypothetical protein E7678_08275, partial [Ruminococcaceae bacterium]|nr:hypothetical protein [Oscillospiraceae bacterium]
MMTLKKYKNKRHLKLTTFGKIFFTIIALIIIGIIFLLARCSSAPERDTSPVNQTTSSTAAKIDAPKTELTVERFKLTDDTKQLKMDSKQGILVNLESKNIIAERNSDKIIYPASLTKVMTLIVAVEN